MTLDVYAGLFADDLDAVADQLDGAFARTNADQARPNRRLDQQHQAVLRSSALQLIIDPADRVGMWKHCS